MASEVGAGTFWQTIVHPCAGPPPAGPCSTRSRPLADPHADPLTRLGITATLGLLLLSQAWRTAAVVAEPALPASPLAVSERWGW
jgi:hypothetical protein